VDHRADLYSLGVVLYELLTGELPVGRFELPSQKAQVDVRLDEIVLHALEREPARRYQHASEVKQDVQRVSSSQVAAPAAVTNPPPSSHSGQSDLPGEKATPRKRPRRHLLQSVLTLVWFLTFVFGVNFMVSAREENGVRMHKVAIGSLDPWFVYDRTPLGFYQSVNFFSWSFLVLVISCIIICAINRIDNEDKGKVDRDADWWRTYWKLSAFWCGVLLLGCVVRVFL
jgi:hypothetical protein